MLFLRLGGLVCGMEGNILQPPPKVNEWPATPPLQSAATFVH